MAAHANNADALSSGGILMIVVAAIGLFSVFTMIICLLALSRKRIRSENQLVTLNRELTSAYFRPFPPNFNSVHTQLQVRSLFPCINDPKFEFRPPSYDEAIRMPSRGTGVYPGVSNNTLVLPSSTSNQRSRTPPPAFSEVDPLPVRTTNTTTITVECEPSNSIVSKPPTNAATISNRYKTFPLRGSSNSAAQQENSTL